jgi:hypothetical protein
MDMRILPKVLLWSMLVVSTLGAISSLVKPEADQTQNARIYSTTITQLMAVQTATNFAREWMAWSEEELPEDRLKRLKPYVNPTALSRIGQIKAEQKNSQQKVIAAEFVSLATSDAHRSTVRVRVVVTNPARTIWEVDIPVWVQFGKGASVTASPVIRPLQNPLAVPESHTTEAAASQTMKERMRPAIESFLKVMCEGKDAESLLNYVRSGTTLFPLQGRIHLVSLDSLEVVGVGPYTASVAFTVQDAATEVEFSQIWRLSVSEENQKFFVGSLN